MTMFIRADIFLYSALQTARDLFLFPVKRGSTKYCSSLQNKVDQLKEKMGVDIPITVAVNDSWSWAAHGCRVYGKAGITVPSKKIPSIYPKNEDTQIALLAHEISHIKHNDGAWFLVIVLVTFAVSTVFLWYVLPAGLLPYAEYFAYIPALVSIFVRSVCQERAADAESCKYLTDSQKQGICNFFDQHRKKQLQYRNKENISGLTRIFRRILIDKNGEYLFGKLTHPTLSSRIQFFREQMNKCSNKNLHAVEGHLNLAI